MPGLKLLIILTCMAATTFTRSQVRAQGEIEIPFMSFQEIQKLSSSQREVLVDGLQMMLLEVEAMQNRHDTSASRFERIEKYLRVLQVENEASAEDGKSAKCVYAGWVLDRDPKSGLCSHPKKGTCTTANSIQCNPLVFGENKCAPIGVWATSQCRKNGKAEDVVAKDFLQHKQEWEKFATDLKGYCDSGKQAAICNLIQARITRIGILAGHDFSSKPQGKPQAKTEVAPSQPPPPPAPPETAAVAAPKPSVAPPVRKTAAQSQAAPSEVISVTADDPNLTPVIPTKSSQLHPDAGSQSIDSGDCKPTLLITEMTTSQASGMAPSFMSLDEAQQLYCNITPISDAWLKRKLAILNAYTTGSLSDKQWIGELKRNFLACVAHAKEFRTRGSPPVITSTYTVTVSAYGLADIVKYDHSEKVGSSNVGHLGMTLRNAHVGLCDVVNQMDGTVHDAFTPTRALQ